ncbi:hypothetical protein Rhopal_006979-T1 [Rhodotorula paludigena]|uniref:Ribosomal eL28/Mak16 domain-containing protein n=1 Tax=Rhodotorula paludigena TaxID=86838 RepID=A0AAV5GMV9_9BASI|nr:hypothetical protein Rhopal_006979-T1 [Rhodotorula paludigena]
MLRSLASFRESSTNAYIHKRRGTGQIFSVERGNLTGLHSPKWSGRANRATLDISTPASGRGLNVSYRKPDASPYAVKSAIETKELKNGKEQAQKEVIQALETIGRPEVYQVALGRTSAVLASQNGTRKPQRARNVRPGPVVQ